MNTIPANEYLPLPQPHEISTREKEDAMGAYLMMFASLGLGLPLPMINLIASVIYFFVNKNKSRFVHFHCLQSLLSQLPTSVLNAVALSWGISILFNSDIENGIDTSEFPSVYAGFVIMTLLVNLIYMIFSLVAASRAYKGRFYYMIFFGRLSYQVAFNAKNAVREENIPVNTPPAL